MIKSNRNMPCRSKLRSSRPAIWLTLLAVLGVFSVTLQAQVQTFLETGFESGIPAGWSQQQITGGATWTIRSGGINGNPPAAHGGTHNVTLYASNTNNNETRLISPNFDTNGYTNITLTFWHTQPVWFSDQDELKVFFSSDGGSSWTQLVHYTQSVSAWTQRTLTLPASSANSRIAFEGNAKYGYGVSLDDVSVQGIPDTFSELSVTATDAEASEEGPSTGTWTISRTGNTSAPLTVNYTLSGSAEPGIDYTVDPPSPVSFADGETSKVVTLTPVDDAVAEGVEVATLTLAPGSGYVVNDLADSANISILDNDPFDLNILIIGSTRSFSDGGEHDVVHEKPFNPSTIASQLRNIIANDPAIPDTVNVSFEDIFKTKTNLVQTSGSGSANITEHCYSLAQHYFWPDGKAGRLANLRGEDGTEWDYIILCGDPYIMANFPGMHAEGVKLIQNEVARSSNPAQVLLLAQWPENSSTFTADAFNEIVHRIGGSAGLTVVPAGKVWGSYTAQDSDAAHPTPKGGYLAASSIYSKLYNRSAATSGYSYPSDGTNIANHALSQVQAIAGVTQYAGAYATVNTFQMKYVTKRTVSFRETGTSTEDRIRFALDRLDDVQRITLTTTGYSDPGGTRWDFNYGRGNDWWEDDKDYEVDPGKYDRSYGFPMHYYNTSTAPLTMPYGIDKHYHGSTYEDGTDLGIAYNMVRPNTRETGLPEGHDVRAIPIRLMWLKMEQISPGFNPLQDSTHMNNHLNDATAAFMYTLLSGRCPVVEEPATIGSTEWLQWLGHKIGYETAWQMAHLTTRAPGFRVLPSSTSATTVSPTTAETMTVQFMNPPQSDVTVTVAASQGTAALVSPQTLTFTPANYNLPQEVTVIGLPGSPSSQPFEVVFSTSSDDEIYDGLSDSWSYTTTRSSTTTVTQVDNGTSHVATAQFTTLDINLGVTGANNGNTIFAGPSHGSITWGGTQDIQYTPSGDFVGADQIVYAVTIGGTQTLGTIDITVQLPDGQVNVIASDAQASEEGPDTGTFVISRLGETTEALDVYFTLGGTATFGDDYTLSHTSPVTIPAGQSSIEITLTPVDDEVFGERDETAILTITENPAYPIGIASATIIIADNDNHPPVVNAGPDQNATLIGGAPWSPSETITQLWLDADDATTLTLDGSAVTQWDDKSGNNRHASQLNTANQPAHTAAGLNGKNVLTFDGTSDFLNLGTGLDFMAGTSHSAFIVVANLATYSNLYGAANGNSGSASMHVGFSNSSTYRMNFWTHDYTTAVTPNFTNTGSILNYVWPVGSPKQILANGKLEGSGPNALAPTAMAGGGRIGNIVGQGYIGGRIAEMVFLAGTVAQADRERMEGYLAHKWGLSDNLDPAHPYKDQAPGGSSVQVSLDGTVTDADGDTPLTLWTKVSGLGTVTFGNASAIDTTATFTQTGTYVLRLTADDGMDQAFDEVTITISEGNDTTPPTILTLDPAHASGDVSPSANLSITFDEAVTFGTGSISLRQNGGALVESFDVGIPAAGLTLNGATITIDPASNLSPGTTYYIEIDVTAIEDLAGNAFTGISGDGTWSFTTVLPDLTPPAVESLSPANGANNIAVGSNLTVTFDEAIAFGIGSITLRLSSGALVESFDVGTPSPRLNLSGTSLAVDPTADLSHSTTYYLEIDATAIDDLAGNSFAGISGSGTWSFTTAAPVAPGAMFLFDFQNDLTTDIAEGAVAVMDLSSPVSANGVTLTASVGNNLGSSRDRGANTGPNSDLTRDFIQWGIATPITITISGLVADQEYAFRLWSGDMAGGQIKTTDHTIAGASGGGTIRHTSVSLADENATGGSLVVFPNVIATSTGTLIYTIDYVTGGGTAATLNGFELAAIGSTADPFTTWADSGTLPGSVTFEGDLNADGVADGLAFLLGVANPDDNAIGALPIVSEDGNGGLVLTFDCLPVADRGGADLKVAYSATLTAWTSTTGVVPDADGADAGGIVSYVVDTETVAPLHRVTVTIDPSAASGDKLFGRLEGTE